MLVRFSPNTKQEEMFRQTAYMPMKHFISVVLLAIVGFMVYGITAGLATVWVYFMGSWIGAPLGFAFGAYYGWRFPLRDTTIIFVCYCLLFGFGCWHCSQATNRPEDMIGRYALWGLITGPGSFYLPRLPVRYLSFTARRTLARGLGITWAVFFAAWVYWRLWMWTP